MSGRLVGACALIIGWLAPSQVMADPVATGLNACRQIASDARRLTCFDELAAAEDAEEFTGSGSGVTPQFDVVTPRLMTFESSDAVMVVYLLNERDEVVQNLHRGGKGEGSYLIEMPGRYHVQVNATGHWKIRVRRAR